ncbi:MAG: methylated-DNA--[protein]-cysteine S-methyltransferase [Thermoprotei archaeon]
MYSEYFDSPIGRYRVVCDDRAVVSVQHTRGGRESHPNDLTHRCVEQLREYFEGERTSFDLPIQFQGGTHFQKRVWGELLRIPYGETRSYKQVAASLGTQGYRAVGVACGRNPIEIIVPCHRVIGLNSLGGYSAGLVVKLYLLKLEARRSGRTEHILKL